MTPACNTAKRISGLAVAVPTLNDETGLLHTAHIQLLQRLRAQGATAFFIASTPADSALSFTERLELAVVSCAAVAGTPIVVSAPSTITDDQLGALTGFASSVLLPGSLNMTPDELNTLASRVRNRGLELILLHRPRTHVVHPLLAPHLASLGVQVLHDTQEIASLYALRQAGVSVLVGTSANLLRAGTPPAAVSDAAVVDMSLVSECLKGDIDAHSELMELEMKFARNRQAWIQRAACDIVALTHL